jgi:arylsulfatase A-like enzyme
LRDRRPNILVVVWDTVRADRLGLYGFEKPTTPFVDEWAAGARVYDDCVSPANYTIASHASIFTGLFPTEHGARNGSIRLADRYTTLAEILRDAGYRTFLYSANPHVSRATGMAQGFEEVRHPWSEDLRGEAFRIVRAKIKTGDRSSGLPKKIRSGQVGPWDIKASGELAAKTALSWLRRSDRKKPFFVFLNYMEAHGPLIPPEKYRRRVLTDEQVKQSYKVDRSWDTVWSCIYGLGEYSDGELAVMEGRYEAAIAELDDLFRDLVAQMDAGGYLENTVVVLASDHGEHLGEQGLVGHQYSLYEPLLRVPLIVRDPARFPPGREKRPVMTHDLFPTLLDLAGVDPPPSRSGGAVSLLSPLEERDRLAESPGVFSDPFDAVLRLHPEWDPRPWTREIRAFYRGGEKLIVWSDGETKLYRLAEDPKETRDLAAAESGTVDGMREGLASAIALLGTGSGGVEGAPDFSEGEREMLRGLGYLSDEGAPAESGAANAAGDSAQSIEE